MTNARDKANIPVLNFQSKGIDDNADATAITINSSEQVGIGTTSPSQLLHVYSTGNDIARIETNQTEGRLSLKDATGEAVLKFRNDYRFTNSTGELARLNSSGNFGIGTTAPGSELHVVADDVSQSWSPYDGTVLTIENNDTDGCVLQTVGRNTATNEIWFGDDDSRNIGRIRYEHSNNVLEFWTNGTEKLCITSTGSVGVNTSSPDAKLEVRDDTNQNTTISASSQLTTSGHYHDFAVASNNADYAVGIRRQVTQSTPSYLNPRMDFFVQNNNTYQSADRGVKMTLLNNGRLGIGTTSPSALLDITGKFSDSVNTNLSLEMGDRWGFRVGTSSTSENLNLDGNLSGTPFTCMTWNKTNGNVIAPLLNTTGSTSNRYPLYWVHSGTVGSIEPYTGSVREMKTDINDMGSVNWIHSLRPRSFKFRDYETDEDGNKVYLETTNNLPNTEYGLIAEEVNEVSGSDYILDKQIDKDGNENLKGVLYHNLVPILLKAVQEQKNTIQELEARITTLEANNT